MVNTKCLPCRTTVLKQVVPMVTYPPCANFVSLPTLQFTLSWFLSDILKADFFLRGQNFSFEFMCRKKCKNITKNHIICVKHEEKTVKEVKMHEFLVCAYKSQDFAQSQTIFALWHDHVTVTFRKSC